MYTVIAEQTIFPGTEGFKYLAYLIQSAKNGKKGNISGFSSEEMGSKSDMYMIFNDMDNYSSTKIHDATEQSYAFLGKQEKIYTPQDDGINSSQNDFNQYNKLNERKIFDEQHFDPRMNIGQNVSFELDRNRNRQGVQNNEFNNFKKIDKILIFQK